MFQQAKTLIKSLVISTSLAAASLTLAEQAPFNPSLSQQGLSEVKSKVFDDFALKSGVTLSEFKKVYIEEVNLTFDKDWLRDNRIDIDKRYLERVQERYPKLFKEALEKALEKNNHLSLSSVAGEDVLSLYMTINNLEIYAPDSRNPSKKQLVKNAGRAELVANIKNASGEALAQIKDRRETHDRQPNTVELTNALLNERDFKWLMRLWSRHLVDHIGKN